MRFEKLGLTSASDSSGYQAAAWTGLSRANLTTEDSATSSDRAELTPVTALNAFQKPRVLSAEEVEDMEALPIRPFPPRPAY